MGPRAASKTSRRRRLLRRVALASLPLSLAAIAGQWLPLAGDGLHDPDNPALGVLQDPASALGRLPADGAGNKVDWVAALRDGYITPRSTLQGHAPVQLLQSTILMSSGGSLPGVLFPHDTHTRWLSCENCHDALFRTTAGATPVTMSAILEGRYCGVCHGAVAFPLTECARCHSAPRDAAANATAR